LPPRVNQRVVGEIGRLLVAAEILGAGYSVAAPEIDIGYDLLAISPGGVWRIQVKSRATVRSPGRFPLHGKSICRRKGIRSYTASEIDAFAFCCLETREFWFVPFSSVNPQSYWFKIRQGEKFRSAWHLLEGGPHAT